MAVGIIHRKLAKQQPEIAPKEAINLLKLRSSSLFFSMAAILTAASLKRNGPLVLAHAGGNA